LNGIISPDKGRVEIRGRVGALIEIGAGFHPMLTGRENIYVNGSILGFSKKEIDKKFDEIVEFAELGDFIDTPVKHYSSGMYVRLGFAIAAQMEPDVMLIDEVLAVGDVGFRDKCLNAIDRISRNSAVIFVSHQMPQISRISSHIIVINQGRPVYQGIDVLQGLEHYNSLFESTQGSISGSGRGTIHRVKIYSNESEAHSEGLVKVKYLDDLYIEVSFSLAPEIPKAIMNIAFFTRDRRGVAQSYSNNGNFEILNKAHIVTTRVRFSKLQLNPGLYYVSIVIGDDNRGETFINHYAIKMVQVVGTFIGFAPLQLRGEWEYAE
ncbi:MAG: ABC transporter ATP-binding protein, partial [Desulfobacteraceae bacterium]|nr:ABC transporter ATP-binding protein [Desulfobacteraceae bacterium]